MGAEPRDDLPRLILHDQDDTLAQLLREGQRMLVQHPQAARALVRAFTAEGHRFAQTADGQAWKTILASSDLVRRGLLIWEAYDLQSLLEDESTILPSTWLDLLTAAVASPDLETILSTLLVEEVRGGGISAS
jgi:hypothetical protein